MIMDDRITSFIADLTELTQRHGVVIGSQEGYYSAWVETMDKHDLAGAYRLTSPHEKIYHAFQWEE